MDSFFFLRFNGFHTATWRAHCLSVVHGVDEERRGKEKEKSPRGYDEDNASQDKFCKIKDKKEEKSTRLTNCQGERVTSRDSGARIHHYPQPDMRAHLFRA